MCTLVCLNGSVVNVCESTLVCACVSYSILLPSVSLSLSLVRLTDDAVKPMSICFLFGSRMKVLNGTMSSRTIEQWREGRACRRQGGSMN